MTETYKQDLLIRRAKELSDELEKTLDEALKNNKKAMKGIVKEVKRNHFIILASLGRKK